MNFEMPRDEIMSIFGYEDINKADIELDHLRELGLLAGDAGFHPFSDVGGVTPSALGLNFYVRCQGFSGSPIDYFGITEEREQSPDFDLEIEPITDPETLRELDGGAHL